MLFSILYQRIKNIKPSMVRPFIIIKTNRTLSKGLNPSKRSKKDATTDFQSISSEPHAKFLIVANLHVFYCSSNCNSILPKGQYFFSVILLLGKIETCFVLLDGVRNVYYRLLVSYNNQIIPIQVKSCWKISCRSERHNDV